MIRGTRTTALSLVILALLLATAPPRGEVDWLSIGMEALGGLVVFLFGVDLLARALREAARDRLKEFLGRAAANRFAGLGAGVAATVALDSSSVVIIMVVAIVDAGLLSFAHALPVVLGSNIGTTFSSQIFAWDVDAFAPVPMAAGLLIRVLAKGEGPRRWGDVILGLGLVLFGLHLIGDAAEPLGRRPELVEQLARLEDPWLGVLAGAAATVALQSSSATVGIVIALAVSGLLTLPAGVAIMLGAEIGTCADTLVATAGRSRGAFKAGLFHLLFNIASVIIGVAFVDALAAFGRATAGSTGQQIANTHVLFNVAGALIMLPFVRTAAHLLDTAVPERREAAPA